MGGGPALTDATSSTIATEAGRWFGRAGMETLANGNTILVYEESTAHNENDDDVIHIRFSNNHGAVWTAEDTDLNGQAVVGFPAYPDDGVADPFGPGDPYIFQTPNGDVYLHTWKTNYDNPSKGMLGTFRIKSTDNGITWGAWEQVSPTGLTEGEIAYLGMTEQHFELGGTLYMLGRIYGDFFTTVKMTLFGSADNGATWAKISDLSAYTDGTHEAAMEYVGNDTILVYHRCVDNAKSYFQKSTDMGATWSPLYRVESAINVIGRNRMFTAAHLAGQANWWTDSKLIMCGFVLNIPGTSTGTGARTNAIWLSEDGGYAWKVITLDTADYDGGYGDIIYDPDTDTYRVVTYKGASLDEANLKQYNFKINWTT